MGHTVEIEIASPLVLGAVIDAQVIGLPGRPPEYVWELTGTVASEEGALFAVLKHDGNDVGMLYTNEGSTHFELSDYSGEMTVTITQTEV